MNVIARDFGSPTALDPESNCTLEMYAAAKALPVHFLSSLGLETIANPYAPRHLALAIPYRNVDRRLHRKRIRAGLTKQRQTGPPDAVGPASRRARDHPLWP
jgi:hypothetical protein